MTTEQKHEIEIPGLPKWWRAVAYRLAKQGEYYWDGISVKYAERNHEAHSHLPVIIIEEIKRHRIVLEETEVNATVSGLTYEAQWFGSICVVNQPKIWRIVEEE